MTGKWQTLNGTQVSWRPVRSLFQVYTYTCPAMGRHLVSSWAGLNPGVQGREQLPLPALWWSVSWPRACPDGLGALSLSLIFEVLLYHGWILLGQEEKFPWFICRGCMVWLSHTCTTQSADGKLPRPGEGRRLAAGYVGIAPEFRRGRKSVFLHSLPCSLLKCLCKLPGLAVLFCIPVSLWGMVLFWREEKEGDEGSGEPCVPWNTLSMFFQCFLGWYRSEKSHVKSPNRLKRSPTYILHSIFSNF